MGGAGRVVWALTVRVRRGERGSEKGTPAAGGGRSADGTCVCHGDGTDF